jgi:hypothetical protein
VIINKYLGKFSAEGKPEGFLLEGINYKTAEKKAELMAQGYVELTQEEWEYYTNNRGSGENGTGYIRDPQTGKPVSAPPRVYTKAELANMANGQAEAELAELNNEIILAQANGDTELVAELNEEKQAVTARYAELLTKIDNGEITDPSQLAPAEEA